MSRRDAVRSHFAADIGDWKKDQDIVGVRILTSGGACGNCASLLGAYRLDDAPEFPPRACEDDYGCSSWWEPVNFGEMPEDGWR